MEGDQNPATPKKTLRGGHDPVAMGKLSAQRRAERKERLSEQVSEVESGSAEPFEPRGDRATARQAFLDVIQNRKSPQAAVVSAARGLAELEGRSGDVPLPTAVAQVRALSDADLHALARQRGLALPWPVEPGAATA